MKTLSILFSEPNVFYAVIDGVNVRIGNHEILKYIDSPCSTGISQNINLQWMVSENDEANRILKSGDIFQVDGFEYEVKFNFEDPCPQCGDNIREQSKGQCLDIRCYKGQKGFNRKVAILKLAKEEDIGIFNEFEQAGYNQAIKDVLKKYRQYESASLMISYKEIESLKK